jgi:monoamine oxidase
MTDVDVVVVGAGIAGLAAARAVVAAGRTVTVLEARDRVAGRTCGHVLSNGVPVEMGGQWVGPTQDEVLALIDELGLETFQGYADGDSLTHYEGTVTRYGDWSFGLDEEASSEVVRLVMEVERLAQTVSLSSPWLTEDARALDEQTVGAWLRSHTDHRGALAFWDTAVPALLCAEVSEVSMLHFLFYVKSGTSFRSLYSTEGGAQESRVVGGTHQIAERMAAELEDAVRLEARVHSIVQDARGVRVLYDGGAVTARRVIVALPPALAGRLHYTPALPAARDALTQQVPMGSVIKVQVVYERPFWREDGLNGLAFSLDDALSVTSDNSPPDLSCGIIVGFFEGEHARRASMLSLGERKKLAVDTLVTLFGPQAADPGEYVDKDWTEEEFSRGCYGGRLGAGVWTQYGAALAEPCGRIHWAGTETSDVWNGYMDGAVRSGRRAAAEALEADG